MSSYLELFGLLGNVLIRALPLILAAFYAVAAYGTEKETIQHLEMTIGMYFWFLVFMIPEKSRKQS